MGRGGGFAAHVASLPKWWMDQHTNGAASFEPPDDFAAMSIANRAHITADQPEELAQLTNQSLPRSLWILRGEELGRKSHPFDQRSSQIFAAVILNEVPTW